MKTLFDALVQVKKDKHGTWHFDCPIGLWSVSCKCKSQAKREAMSYFSLYKSDGEYDELAKRYGMII
ncbi:hypothetical protein NVP1178O_08 [Vibrio phage 1.178.O._10N.286.45.E12]|nr:hypothetical protein NVP1178O_08 [Vibrio phage 1.178.O._10N.286.45.E12]